MKTIKTRSFLILITGLVEIAMLGPGTSMFSTIQWKLDSQNYFPALTESERQLNYAKLYTSIQLYMKIHTIIDVVLTSISSHLSTDSLVQIHEYRFMGTLGARKSLHES